MPIDRFTKPKEIKIQLSLCENDKVKHILRMKYQLDLAVAKLSQQLSFQNDNVERRKQCLSSGENE